jgi:peptidoglycan hydrolase-like protein with peptidoglycan-binding domain
MKKGSYRSTFAAAPTVRGAAALVLCALLLTGCENVKELKETLWPFEPNSAGEGDERPLAATAEDEVAPEPALVTKVQSRLSELGYQPGPVDGVMGPKTRSALRRYQMVEGLPVDGRITQPLLVRLTGSSAAAEPQPKAQSNPQSEAQSEPPAPGASAAGAGRVLGPPPAYQEGSRFVYADGEVRTVVSVDGDQVDWQSSRDGYAVARSNFLLPSLSWSSSETGGQRTIDEPAHDLWPHASGEAITFSARTLIKQKTQPDGGREITETWRCQVGAEAELAVRAGTFATRRITCDGELQPDGTSLTKTWHYAPELGHYVLFEETDADGRSQRRSELLAIMPSTETWPPAARAGLGWALEHALETSADGERTTWSSSAVDLEVVIEPGARVAFGEKDTCRNFVQIWSEPDGERVYPGLSCREASGEWRIPGPKSGIAVATGGE